LEDLSPHFGQVQPDASASTVALVKQVTEIGPDISEISRRLGQFKESVRYRYKEKLVKRGFAIKAEPDYGALGLTRIVVKLVVSDEYAAHAPKVFETMGDLCYLVAYAGTMPNGAYLAQAAVPTEFTSEFHGVMDILKERGVFSSVEYFDCPWHRVAPMRAECFDFDEGVWDFDWSSLPAFDEEAARGSVSEKKRLDKVDLLILKELSKEGDRSLTEIQAAIKRINGVDVNYKTLGWHYARHVQGQRLVSHYSVGWHGLNYDFERGQDVGFARYDYLGVALLVRDVGGEDRMMLRSQMNRLPFLWSEAAGEAYFSQLFIPLNVLNEALEHFKKVLEPYRERAELMFLDKREMKYFTICYNQWDESKGRWAFEQAELLPRLERSALNVR
jgi:DNA-binding Lrp family transcriptional regulator